MKQSLHDLYIFCSHNGWGICWSQLIELVDPTGESHAYKVKCFIIPHVNFPYKTSLDKQLIFHNITGCYSNGEYCHVFAKAASDIIKYKGGHMMRNADARTVCSRQEMFNSNGGHDT